MSFEDFQGGNHGGHLGYLNGVFSSSEAPCCSDAYYQVSAQNDLRFGMRCGLKNFKVAARAKSLLQ